LRATDDRRQVLVKLTRDGEAFLEKLSLHHLQELQSAGLRFVRVLQSLLDETMSSDTEDSVTLQSNIPARIKRRKDTRHG
jgi:DNA-binding MarR family transcriptional regulator